MATATPTDLTDTQWILIRPLLPPRARRGRPRADDRRTLNGILWVLRTGARWADLPRRYGACSTCHARLRHWQCEGVWERVWRTLLSRLDQQHALDWQRGHLDGTFIPAKKGGEAVGLTKRGQGSKLMAVVDGHGMPLGLLVASAQRAEIKLAEPTLATICVPGRCGRPKTRPKELVADKAYDSQSFRERLRCRGIRPCIRTVMGSGRGAGESRTWSLTGSDGMWNAASPGSKASVACSCGMRGSSRCTWRSSTSQPSWSAYGEHTLTDLLQASSTTSLSSSTGRSAVEVACCS
jgi:transposase